MFDTDCGGPQHGGNLSHAMAEFGGQAEQWLDLSTGISPYSWPVAKVLTRAPSSCWHQLPDDDLYQATQSAAAEYYAPLSQAGCEQYVLASGTQAIIQQLPVFFAASVYQKPVSELRIWVMAGSYGEHRYCWRKAGAQVAEKSAQQLRDSLQDLHAGLPDVLLLVNPDNPSGESWTYDEIQSWQKRLSKNDGWLILDCAFADSNGEVFSNNKAEGFSNNENGTENTRQSENNLLLLTSIGKFFGLAGLRFGCCILPPQWAQRLREQLGPWPVSGLTLWLAQQAFADHVWQQQNRMAIQQIQQQLIDACEGLPVYGTTPLFITLQSSEAEYWQQQLASRKIWSRCFKQQNLLRLGLPQQHNFERLQLALTSLKAGSIK